MCIIETLESVKKKAKVGFILLCSELVSISNFSALPKAGPQSQVSVDEKEVISDDAVLPGIANIHIGFHN